MPRPALRRIITKRASVILLLLIVAGAIVNVAVAWGSLVLDPEAPADVPWKVVLRRRFAEGPSAGFPLHSLKWGNNAGYLPQTVLWPGLAINTLFYAAILWTLVAVPFALRRKRRIKRGLCPKCAYPIGASDVCTECGQSVQPRRGDGSPLAA